MRYSLQHEDFQFFYNKLYVYRVIVDAWTYGNLYAIYIILHDQFEFHEIVEKILEVNSASY